MSQRVSANNNYKDSYSLATAASGASTQSSGAAAVATAEQLRASLHQVVDQAIDKFRDDLMSAFSARDAELDRLSRLNSRLSGDLARKEALLSHEKAVSKHLAQQIRILRDSTNHGDASCRAAGTAVVTGIRKRRNRDTSADSTLSMAARQPSASGIDRHKRRRTQPAMRTPAPPPPLQPEPQQQQQQQHRRLTRSSAGSATLTDNDEDSEESADESDNDFNENTEADISSSTNNNATGSACEHLGIELSPPSRLLAPQSARSTTARQGRGRRNAVVNHRDLQLNVTGVSIASAAPAPASAASADVAVVEVTGATMDASVVVAGGCNFQQLDSTAIEAASAAGVAQRRKPKLGGSPTKPKPLFKPPLPPARGGSAAKKPTTTATNQQQQQQSEAAKKFAMSPLYCSTLRVNSKDFDPESDRPIGSRPTTVSASSSSASSSSTPTPATRRREPVGSSAPAAAAVVGTN